MVEVNPSKFSNTELIREKGSLLTQVFNKPHKFPVHWSFKIPIRYKHNTIIEELHRAKRIASNFDKEIQRIREKDWNAGLLVKLSVILKKKQTNLLYLNGCLKKEKYLLWDFHAHL